MLKCENPSSTQPGGRQQPTDEIESEPTGTQQQIDTHESESEDELVEETKSNPGGRRKQIRT